MSAATLFHFTEHVKKISRFMRLTHGRRGADKIQLNLLPWFINDIHNKTTRILKLYHVKYIDLCASVCVDTHRERENCSFHVQQHSTNSKPIKALYNTTKLMKINAAIYLVLSVPASAMRFASYCVIDLHSALNASERRKDNVVCIQPTSLAFCHTCKIISGGIA